MSSHPEWLQEIYRMKDAQDFTAITKEDVLKLVEWTENNKHSEEDAILLLRFLRVFEKELSISWEPYYKRFIHKYQNLSLAARFYRLASHYYLMEGKIVEAEEAATQALSLNAGDYNNLYTYLTTVAGLSINTRIQLIEQCLVLRPNNLMAKYNAIVDLFRLYQSNATTAQKIHQRILDLCSELLAETIENKSHVQNIVEIRHRVSTGNT